MTKIEVSVGGDVAEVRHLLTGQSAWSTTDSQDVLTDVYGMV